MQTSGSKKCKDLVLRRLTRSVKKKGIASMLVIALLVSLWSGFVSAATTNTKNIIIALKPKQNFTSSASVYLTFTDDMELVAASPGSGMYYDDLSLPVVTSSGTVRATYHCSSSPFIGTDTQMLVLRFDTALTASEAYNAVTLESASITTVPGATYSGDAAFSLIKIMVGDINNNGTVDASDGLMPQQYAVDLITLTEAQKLAADVNNDGKIDSGDTLMINQYSVQTITTFWRDYSPVTLPTIANSDIKSDMVYRIENVFGKKGLNTTANAAAGAYVNQTNYKYSAAAQRYKLTYVSSGAYEITPMNASGKVLSIVSGRLCVETDTNVSRQRWYIVPVSGGNLIINKAYPSQCLTIDGIAASGKPVYSGTSAFGNKWELHEITETVENYFDNGMLTRWNLSTSQMRTQINQYMQTAANLYHEVFGITIEYDTPTRYTTLADTCTAEKNSDGQCLAHTPNCTDNREIWSEFRADHPGNANMVPILWTGHVTWEERADGSIKTVQDGGVYSSLHSIIMLNTGTVNHTTFTPNPRIEHTVCHELAHEFGAHDTYCNVELNNPNPCPENCYAHGGYGTYLRECIMTKAVSLTDAENDFCSQCEADIIEHLNAAH